MTDDFMITLINEKQVNWKKNNIAMVKHFEIQYV